MADLFAAEYDDFMMGERRHWCQSAPMLCQMGISGSFYCVFTVKSASSS